MSLHNKKWKIESNQPIGIESDLHPIVKQVIVNRGFDTDEKVEKFLQADLSQLYDPFLMKDMEKVVKRLETAFEKEESIWIYGDYDVDGITSISVLMKCFDLLGVDANYYIPNRLDEGYGLSIPALSYIIDQGADLVISVDCGITSIEEVDYMNSRHIDIIITDHHNCQEVLPNAFAILNPKQADCHYPYDMLAGVGIAMKVVQGLLGNVFLEQYHRFMDITALGTVADIAPLTDENRIITKLGLDVLNETQNPGIEALIKVSDLKNKINAGHIGFNLGPKINAAGRIGKPQLGVELLTSNDLDHALHIAMTLNDLNTERQAIEKEIIETIDDLIDHQVDLEKDKIIVVVGDDWHTGVIGIVASRITEKYHRPSVILSREEGIAKGSARSIGNISIYDALNACKHLFIGFGGHKQAAGLSLKAEDVNSLRQEINAYAKEHISEADLLPRIKVDGILHANEITYTTLDDLELLEPHGLGNPKPVFVYNGLTIDTVRKLGQEKDHLKLILHDDKRTFDAIAFRVGDSYNDLRSQDKLDMVLTLSKNSFRGIDTIQFMIKDLRRLEPEFYRQTEIGKCFTKTLARSLFYNSIGGLVEKPSYVFGQNIHYERGNINRLDYATDIRGKKLILVQSFFNFIELYFRLDDLNIEEEKLKISFNEIDQPSQNDILVNPLLGKINFDTYDEVVVYDFLYSGSWANRLESMYTGRISYLTKPYMDEKLQLERLYTAIPHRMDLVDVYKHILSEEGALTIELEGLAKVLHMDVIKTELSIRILNELNLISIVEDASYHITVSPKPDKKLQLSETDIYKQVTTILDDFFTYIKAYKEIIK